MKIETSQEFKEAFASAPLTVQRAVHKQGDFLLRNLRHPSLRAKKYNQDTWQARVNKNWRFYFIIHGDTYYLTSLIKHPK